MQQIAHTAESVWIWDMIMPLSIADYVLDRLEHCKVAARVLLDFSDLVQAS